MKVTDGKLVRCCRSNSFSTCQHCSHNLEHHELFDDDGRKKGCSHTGNRIHGSPLQWVKIVCRCKCIPVIGSEEELELLELGKEGVAKLREDEENEAREANQRGDVRRERARAGTGLPRNTSTLAGREAGEPTKAESQG